MSRDGFTGSSRSVSTAVTDWWRLQPKLRGMGVTSRARLHCHTSPSMSPEQVYEQAKASGMDFVTITDRDSIDGVLSIADRPDVFMSVELTARVRDCQRALQVCCYGISAFDHAWLQRRSDDVEVCLAYLREHGIAFSTGSCSSPGDACTMTPRAETPWESSRTSAGLRSSMADAKGCAHRRG